MPFIQRFGPIHTSVKLRCKVLRKANQSLNQKEDVGDEAENGVGRLKVCAFVGKLVNFNDYEASNEDVEGKLVDGEMGDGAFAFLVGGVGGL
jgi:hypothetical protein